MKNEEKCGIIREWIDPEERVTVDFLDEKDLNAEITACTIDYVELAVETRFPHLKQKLSVPLSAVELSEDRSKYTRDPEQPLRHERLKLVIQQDRPQWV